MSREEEMLTAIVQGDPITDEPMCRQEEYLKAIANNSGTSGLPEPMCRTEVLLKQIAEVINTGGGSTEGTLNATTIYGVWGWYSDTTAIDFIFKEDGNAYGYMDGQLMASMSYSIQDNTVVMTDGDHEEIGVYSKTEDGEILTINDTSLAKQYYPDKEYSVSANGEYSVPDGATNIVVDVPTTLNATTIYGVWTSGAGEEGCFIFREDGNCYGYSNNGQLIDQYPYTINNNTITLTLGADSDEFSFVYANADGKETLTNEELQIIMIKQYYPDKEYSVTENGEYSIPEGATNVSVNVSSGGGNIAPAIADGTVTSVDLTGVTYIRDYAFHNCTQLAEVNMPNVYEIGMFAFGGCPIANIDIPEGCTTIQDNAFETNSALQSVVFPSTIDWIGANVFINAPAEAFIVENGLKYIASRNGDKMYCVGLADTTLTSYPIKSGTTLMCRALFNSEWIVNPFSVEIPASLPEITTGAFSSTQLSDITFAENSTLTAIGADAFSNCSNLTSIILPNTITTIEGNSFAGCSNLSSITLPTAITAIEYSTFSYCSSLTNITIPAGVQSIGSNAFAECSNLSTITILTPTPPTIEADTFSGCPIIVINIPTGTLESYQNTENWNNFTGLFNEI